MNLVVAGGTGFVGKALVEKFVADGHHVTLLSRNAERVRKSLPEDVDAVTWDAENVGEWTDALEAVDAVINLGGEGIAAKKWSAEQKRKILESRVHSTRAIVKAIKTLDKKPKTLINASAIGIYGHVDEDDVSEAYEKGTGFLADTCDAWEKEAMMAGALGVRVILLRIGIVLEEGGGALEKMLPPFKFFIGGPLGSGKQWFPWVHRDDILGMIAFLLKNEDIKGPVNAVSPQPVRMKEFCSALGRVLFRPSLFPVPGFVLQILLGEMAKEMLLAGQKVVPTVLQEAGYEFEFPEVESALRSILYHD